MRTTKLSHLGELQDGSHQMFTIFTSFFGRSTLTECCNLFLSRPMIKRLRTPMSNAFEVEFSTDGHNANPKHLFQIPRLAGIIGHLQTD